MTLANDNDVDQEVAGLVAFHRGRAAGHRRAFLDSMDLLQGAAARAADAEAELGELRAEVSAMRQRLQNDTAAHREIAGKLGQQVEEARREAEQHKAKVQQLLGEQQAARDDVAALHCSLDQAGAPTSEGPELLTLVRRIDWLGKTLRESEGRRTELFLKIPTAFAGPVPEGCRFVVAIKDAVQGRCISTWAKDANDLREHIGKQFGTLTGIGLQAYGTSEHLAAIRNRQDKEAAELARAEAERERDEAIARAEAAENELREIKRQPGDADQETNSTAGPGPEVCR